MKYIDAEKLIAEIERRIARLDKELIPAAEEDFVSSWASTAKNKRVALQSILSFIASLQQEQPEGNLEYWLEHFGMPKENIDNCITQIAQGYGACRYLEGIQHGAEAVNELAKQEQPSLPSNLDEAAKEFNRNYIPFDQCDSRDIRRAFKAGAEWMAGQGVKASASVGYYNQCGLSILTEPSIKKLGFKEGDDLEITIRKK